MTIFKKSLDGFEAHARKLMNELVTQDELESAKMILKQKICKANRAPAFKNCPACNESASALWR